MIPRAKSVAANLILATFCGIIPWLAWSVFIPFGLLLMVTLWPLAGWYFLRAATFQIEGEFIGSPAPDVSPLVSVPQTASVRSDNFHGFMQWVVSMHPGWPRSAQLQYVDHLTSFFGEVRWDGTNQSDRFAQAVATYLRDPRFNSRINVDLVAIRSSDELFHPSLKERMRVAPQTSITSHFRITVRGTEIGFVVLDVHPGTDELVLYELFIAPQSRGQGFGAATLQAVEDEAWAIGRPAVVVRPRSIDPTSLSDGELASWYYRRGYRSVAGDVWRKMLA